MAKLVACFPLVPKVPVLNPGTYFKKSEVGISYVGLLNGFGGAVVALFVFICGNK
jgi:hypothetical protein